MKKLYKTCGNAASGLKKGWKRMKQWSLKSPSSETTYPGSDVASRIFTKDCDDTELTATVEKLKDESRQLKQLRYELQHRISLL